MNFGEIKEEIRDNGFGDHEAGIAEERVARWANHALQRLSVDAPGDWLQATFSTSTSSATTSLPAANAMVVAVTWNGGPLGSFSFPDYLDYTDNSTPAGTPQHFALFERTLYLAPAPSTSGTLKIFYVGRPALMVSDGDVPAIPAEHHQLIVLLACAFGWREIGEDGRADLAMKEYQSLVGPAAGKLRDEQNARAAGSADDTLASLRQEIRGHGFNLGDPVLSGYLNDALLDVAGRGPWPFLKEQTTVSLEMGNPVVELPSDCMKPIKLINDVGEALDYQSDQERLAGPVGTDERDRGRPYTYMVYGSNQLRLYPTPQSDATYTLWYLKEPAQLTAATDTAPFPNRRYRRVILYYALAQAARRTAREKDPDGRTSGSGINARLQQAKDFEDQYERRIEGMKEAYLVDQLDQNDQIIAANGGWNDYYYDDEDY